MLLSGGNNDKNIDTYRICFYHVKKQRASERLVFLGNTISENTTRINLKFIAIDRAPLK
jgi:hypothetical protein